MFRCKTVFCVLSGSAWYKGAKLEKKNGPVERLMFPLSADGNDNARVGTHHGLGGGLISKDKLLTRAAASRDRDKAFPTTDRTNRDNTGSNKDNSTASNSPFSLPTNEAA